MRFASYVLAAIVGGLIAVVLYREIGSSRPVTEPPKPTHEPYRESRRMHDHGVEVTTWGELGSPSTLLPAEIAIEVGDRVTWFGNQPFTIENAPPDGSVPGIASDIPYRWGTRSAVSGRDAFHLAFTTLGTHRYIVRVSGPSGGDRVLRGIVEVKP